MIRLTGGAGGGGGGESSFGGMFNGRIGFRGRRMGSSGRFIGRLSGGADVIRMTVGRMRRVKGNGLGGHDEREEKKKGRRGRSSHVTESEGVREAQTGRKQQGVNTMRCVCPNATRALGVVVGKKRFGVGRVQLPGQATASMQHSTGICLSSGRRAAEALRP